MPPPPSASVLGTPGAAPRPIMGDPQAPARPAPARRRRKTAPPATQRRRQTGPPWPTIAAPPSISAAAVYILPRWAYPWVRLILLFLFRDPPWALARRSTGAAGHQGRRRPLFAPVRSVKRKKEMCIFALRPLGKVVICGLILVSCRSCKSPPRSIRSSQPAPPKAHLQI
jgi:hypothetical protein